MPLETYIPQILDPWRWNAAFTNARGQILRFTGEIRVAADLEMLPEQVTEAVCAIFKVSDRYTGLTLKLIHIRKVEP